MTKHYGAKCSTVIQGQCAQGWPGWSCECDGVNCSEWPVGDFGVWHLTGDELQKALEASTTKFWGKYNGAGLLVLEEVGMLANAGLQKGDALFSIFEGRKSFLMEDDGDHEAILTWQFTRPKVVVNYIRNGELLTGTMANPAYKESTQ